VLPFLIVGDRRVRLSDLVEWIKEKERELAQAPNSSVLPFADAAMWKN
jgi:hypothetical protein